MIMQVHDELIFETPKANAEETLNLMKDMIKACFNCRCSNRQNWNEAQF